MDVPSVVTAEVGTASAAAVDVVTISTDPVAPERRSGAPSSAMTTRYAVVVDAASGATEIEATSPVSGASAPSSRTVAGWPRATEVIPSTGTE